jgi:hypothetical protein
MLLLMPCSLEVSWCSICGIGLDGLVLYTHPANVAEANPCYTNARHDAIDFLGCSKRCLGVKKGNLMCSGLSSQASWGSCGTNVG